MTVKELIEELSNYDDDQIVAVSTIFDSTKVEPIIDIDIDYVDNICEDDDGVVLYS